MAKYRAVWYFTAAGSKPAKEFLVEQDEKARAKIARAIAELEEMGPELHRPKAAKIRDSLYELRIEFSPNNYRIIYYFCIQRNIVLLSAFKKKTQKLDPGELETAARRKDDFNLRLNKGEILL